MLTISYCPGNVNVVCGPSRTSPVQCAKLHDIDDFDLDKRLARWGQGGGVKVVSVHVDEEMRLRGWRGRLRTLCVCACICGSSVGPRSGGVGAR